MTRELGSQAPEIGNRLLAAARGLSGKQKAMALIGTLLASAGASEGQYQALAPHSTFNLVYHPGMETDIPLNELVADLARHGWNSTITINGCGHCVVRFSNETQERRYASLEDAVREIKGAKDGN